MMEDFEQNDDLEQSGDRGGRQWRNARIGVVKSDNNWLLVAADSDTREFIVLNDEDSSHTDMSSVPLNRQIFGYSASQSTFRKVHLPFKRERQIQMLLPQEIADNSLNKKDHPRFAFHSMPDDVGADIVYAVTEQEQLQQSIDELEQHQLACGPVVLAELASWPLLDHQKLIGEETTLIIDASMYPYALIKVCAEKLLDFRVLSKSVCRSGDMTVIARELNWLANSMLSSEEIADVVVLGNLPQQCLQLLPQHRLIELQQFSIDDWRWLRALGLTAVDDQDWLNRMMNFRWGEFAFQSPWKLWFKPWVPAFSIGLVVFCLAVTQFTLDYFGLKDRQQTLSQEMNKAFVAALPNTPMVDPVRQLQQALPQAGQIDDRSLVAWLSIVQPLLTGNADGESEVKFQRLFYDDSGIVLQGNVSNYEQLDVLQEGLKKATGVVSVSLEDANKSSNADFIQFRLRVRR